MPHCLFCFLLQSVAEYLLDLGQHNDLTDKSLREKFQDLYLAEEKAVVISE